MKNFCLFLSLTISIYFPSFAQTSLVKDIYAGKNPYSESDPSNITDVNGIVFFTARNESGIELWKSDGTAAGTVIVKEIFEGAYSSKPEFLTNVNGTLFFSATSMDYGRELWKSDGTTAGTVMVKDLNTTGSSNPEALVNINGTLFFRADNGSNGIEL